jgi:hypothetical protein
MSPEPKPRSMAAVTITVLRFRESASLSKTKLFAGNSSITAVWYSPRAFQQLATVKSQRTWGQSAGKAHFCSGNPQRLYVWN